MVHKKRKFKSEIEETRGKKKFRKIENTQDDDTEVAEPQVFVKPAVSDTFYVIPWSSDEEWEHLCSLFSSGSFGELLTEISTMRERVPSLPVGVEASLYLINAIEYDESLKKFTTRTKASDTEFALLSLDHARSLYSLAVIRFLNHVSQLVTKELGGRATVAMTELVSLVQVPEWIVNLRHEASHGTALPTIQIMRLASTFIRQWLQEHYWTTAPTSILTNQQEVQDESEQWEQVSEYLSAFAACRIYQIRSRNVIYDEDILKLVSCTRGSISSTEATSIIKTKLANFLCINDSLVATAIGHHLVPSQDFCKEFSSALHLSTTGTSRNVVFERLLSVWNPLLKLMDKKNRLVNNVIAVTDVFVQDDMTEDCRTIAALWLDYLLDQIISAGKDVSRRLLPVLRLVAENPKCQTSIFVDKLIYITSVRFDSDRIEMIRKLINIWTVGQNANSRRMKSKSAPFVSLDDLLKSEKNGTCDPLSKTLEAFSTNWELDIRDSGFWRNQPCGSVL